ncbi:Fatty acid synthase [Camponotus floridanus]|uniref:oleoyl-[acyl-carrier-protein] hydrolase n=1 Tax=Camponotus floridanus TaxID=104421 RepID=E2ABR4_CAMFO|nr:Fatty acid synthase [Camponotus floridanus]
MSSMVVAEKKKDSGQARNPFEVAANIMGLKNPNTVAPNMPLAELGMDSMMAVEIKQILEREFDILLTAQDIRNLTFAKLRKLTNTAEQEKLYQRNDIKANVKDMDGLKILTRKLNDSDLNPNIYIKLAIKREVAGSEIFLIPGIDGSASVYKLIGSKIKSSATCLQHGVVNMPNVTRSVMKSAAYLLPHVLEKIQSQKEFRIVGYSFGSLIAIELARLLEAKNFFGRLLLIDGAPDQMKFLFEKFFYHTTEQELQNSILLYLIKLYLDSNNEMLELELNKCNTWKEKLELLTARFSKAINVLTVENQKFLCSTLYDHIIAIQDYHITSLPRLKSSIILLKPTLTPITFTEEDYGLHKARDVSGEYVERGGVFRLVVDVGYEFAAHEHVDPPIDRYDRVLKERIAWSVATYPPSTSRAIGLRDAREELWIETVLVCSGRVARFHAGDTRRRRASRGFSLPVDSRGETLWIRIRAGESKDDDESL